MTEKTVELKAVEDGIKKWIGIRKGLWTLVKGIEQCALCRKFLLTGSSDIRDCTYCPLDRAGFGCLTKKSNWRKYDRVIRSLDLKESRFYRIGINAKWILRPRINKMIHNLQKTRDLLKQDKL